MPQVRDARDSISELFRQEQTKHKPAYACTVVSLMPLRINEEKPHMLPSTFIIPAAKNGGISVLHVGEGIHYIPHPIDDYSIKQVTPPHEMARSVVQDYSSAQIALGEDAGPGIFFVEGVYDANEIEKEFPEELEAARKKQKQWFRNLVGLADADFTKNRNVMAVSDLQREAARALGIKREWVDFIPEETNACPFCAAQISAAVIKCPICREIVNAEAYKKLKESMDV